jgi:E3 ubiquitin-protein ligase TRIP12
MYSSEEEDNLSQTAVTSRAKTSSKKVNKRRTSEHKNHWQRTQQRYIERTLLKKRTRKESKKNKQNKKQKLDSSSQQDYSDDDMSDNINREQTLENLLDSLGGYGSVSRGATLAGEKAEQIMRGLSDSADEGQQLESVSELCNFFSIGTEQSLSSSHVERYVPQLIALLNKEHNYDLMILSARALTHMIDVFPGSGSYVIRDGAAPVLASKLLNIEYIDLAEQCIQCLELLSYEHGPTLLREGVLMATLCFVDFFSMNMQKKILKIAVNLCRRIHPSQFSFVTDALPNLQNFLNYEDSSIVECAVKCFYHIATCIAMDSEKVERLCGIREDNYNGALLDRLQQFLESLATTSVPNSRTTINLILNLLALLARGSFKVTKVLHEKGIAMILSNLLQFETPSDGSVLSSPSAKRTERTPLDHFNEVVVLLDELLPKNIGEDRYISELPVSVRKMLLQNLVHPTNTEDHGRKENKIDAKAEMLANNQALLLTLGESIVPPLMHLFSSNHNEAVSYRCLTVIGTIINNSNSDTIRIMLRQIPFSTFLSNLLSSNDMVFVGCALQMCLVLLQKLPDVFLAYFVREGVVNQARKIAGRDDNKMKRMIDIMKEKTEKAFKKAQKEHEKKVEQAKKDEEERIRREKVEESSKKSEVITKQVEEEKMKKTTKRLVDFFQKKAREQQSGSTSTVKIDAQSTSPTTPHSNVSIPFVPPVVTPPVPPDQSRLSVKKCDQTSLKAQELISYVVALAQRLIEDYYSDGKYSFENEIVSKLKFLATELSESDEENEKEILTKIRKALIMEEEGVSNYEVLMSGIIHAINKYITEGDDNTRMRRLQLFIKLFDLPIEAESKQEEDSNDSIQEDDESGIRIKCKKSITVLSGSPIRSFLGASPSNSSLMKRNRTDAKHTYLLELVRRLGSCFSSLENFPLVVSEHVTMLTGISNAVATLGKSFKIKLQKVTSLIEKEWEQEQTSTSKKKKKQQPKSVEPTSEDIHVDVMVTPLTRVHALERFVFKFEEKRRKQEEEAEQSMDESDETNYFEVDENADNDEDSQISNTTIITIDRPREGTKRYEFLDIPKENDHHVEKYTRKYELIIDGHVLKPTSSVMNALYEYELLKTKHPSTIRLNDGEHTIYYRELDDSDENMNEEDRDYVLYSNNDYDIDNVQFFNRKIDQKLNLTADDDLLDSLELLRILNIVNENPNLIPNRENNMTPFVDPQEFLNTKLSSKVVRQLQDPYMLFANCSPEWVDVLIYSCPFLFSYDTRRLYFSLTSLGIARAIQKIQDRRVQDHNSRRNRNHVVRIEKTKLRLAREPNILQSAFQVLESHDSSRAVLEFEYYDEEGTGLGPTAEFYSLVSRELQVAALDIWRDSKTIDPNDDRLVSVQELFPRPINVNDKARVARTSRLFEFMGKFVARALLDARIIDLPFSNCFLRAVRGDRLTFKDLKEIEPVYYKQLDAMRRLVQKRRKIEMEESNEETLKKRIECLTLNDDGVSSLDALCQVFVVPGYPDVELVPGGADKDVTVWNVHEYIELVARYLLNDGIKVQIEAFRRGYESLLPTPGISTWKVFSPAELDDMVCGCHEEIWDEDRLTEATRCDHGFSHSSRVIKMLFKVMSEMTTEERRLFIQFVTGSPKLPSGGIKNLKPKLTIVLKVPEKGKVADQYLPSVMTCTNYLKLPEYSSEQVLKEQLFKAIRMGQNAFLLS